VSKTYFPTTVKGIDSSSKLTTALRILEANFGQGYSQTAADGLNNQVDTWDVVFSNISQADKITVMNFLRSVGGSTTFYWTPIDETVEKMWKITKDGWTVSNSGGSTWTITFKMTQQFGTQ
jgi:phage-related protein